MDDERVESIRRKIGYMEDLIGVMDSVLTGVEEEIEGLSGIRISEYRYRVLEFE